GVLTVGARRGDEREPAALLRAHRRAQLRRLDGRVAQEPDLAHLDLGVLVDVKVDVDVLIVLALHVGADVDEVEALLDVEVLDLLDVALDLGEVDDGLALDVQDLVDLVEADLVRARNVDLADDGLFAQHEDEIDLATRLASLDLHVLEEAQAPDAADVV